MLRKKTFAILTIFILSVGLLSGCAEKTTNSVNANHPTYDDWLDTNPYYHVIGEIIEVTTYERSWGDSMYGGLQSYVIITLNNATRITTFGEDFMIST
ncbi:unnamed protein product [marine sediment metagenome]|uniref:Uncharacterized protein n=1 Tax=marine sediment metagenome TaxID=412755 RepID=X1AW59_9ZZZZ